MTVFSVSFLGKLLAFVFSLLAEPLLAIWPFLVFRASLFKVMRTFKLLIYKEIIPMCFFGIASAIEGFDTGRMIEKLAATVVIWSGNPMKTYLQHLFHPLNLWCLVGGRGMWCFKLYERWFWQPLLRPLLAGYAESMEKRTQTPWISTALTVGIPLLRMTNSWQFIATS